MSLNTGPRPNSDNKATTGSTSGAAVKENQTHPICMEENPKMLAALEQYRQGATHMEQLLKNLYTALEHERTELQQEQEQLEADRKAFQEEAGRVQQVLADHEQMQLNVGGRRFTTTVSTLRNAPAPSLFNAMFSGRHALKKDEDGCVFIDRDGRHFHDILNFLRDGSLAYPPDGNDFKYLLELRAEAEFYGLTGLVSQIDRYPYAVTRVTRAVTLNPDDSWMYEDGQDEVVFSVDRSCQLLGVALCGTEGSYTAELEVYEVSADDYEKEVDTISSAAQSFTKSDGQVCKMMLPTPVMLQPDKVYMISAVIKGSESYCCEDCLQCVVAGGVKVKFHDWESPNGTNQQRGQFPELYIRCMGDTGRRTF